MVWSRTVLHLPHRSIDIDNDKLDQNSTKKGKKLVRDNGPKIVHGNSKHKFIESTELMEFWRFPIRLELTIERKAVSALDNQDEPINRDMAQRLFASVWPCDSDIHGLRLVWNSKMQRAATVAEVT